MGGGGAAAKLSKGKAGGRKDERNRQGAGKSRSFIPHHESKGACCETLGTRKGWQSPGVRLSFVKC